MPGREPLDLMNEVENVLADPFLCHELAAWNGQRVSGGL